MTVWFPDLRPRLRFESEAVMCEYVRWKLAPLWLWDAYEQEYVLT